MRTMKISPVGKKVLIQEFENCKLEAYLDGGGVWTIGWGHTAGVRKGDTCSQAQADAWLEEDIADAEEDVNLYVRGWLLQGQFDALCSLAYNIGGNAFRKSTLVRMLNSGNLEGAAKEFLRWKFDNGMEVKGLLRRRVAEQKMFLEAK